MKMIRLFLNMIQFKHTIFSLPFVLAGGWLAAEGAPKANKLFLILLAAVLVRTLGMCVNRLADLKYDGLNPRTADRPLVTGRIPLIAPIVSSIVCGILFILVAYLLNSLSFYLSPIAIGLAVLYSFLKRWTVLCHFGLGLVISLAPLGGYVGIQGAIHMEALWLTLAVFFWASGFDILYSVQDMEFDRRIGLHSIPSKFGKFTALNISSLCHAIAFVCLWELGQTYPMKSIYQLGWIAAGLILIAEHVLIRIDFNKFVGFSFFTLNGVLSLLYMAAICVSV